MRWSARDYLAYAERRLGRHQARQGQITAPAPPTGATLRYTLPWPPSTNVDKAGDHHLLQVTRRFRHDVAMIVAIAKVEDRPVPPLSVTLRVTPPDRRRRDPDNVIKPTLDALVKAGALADDSASVIRHIELFWREPQPAAPHVAIEIREFRNP